MKRRLLYFSFLLCITILRPLSTVPIFSFRFKTITSYEAREPTLQAPFWMVANFISVGSPTIRYSGANPGRELAFWNGERSKTKNWRSKIRVRIQRSERKTISHISFGSLGWNRNVNSNCDVYLCFIAAAYNMNNVQTKCISRV